MDFKTEDDFKTRMWNFVSHYAAGKSRESAGTDHQSFSAPDQRNTGKIGNCTFGHNVATAGLDKIGCRAMDRSMLDLLPKLPEFREGWIKARITQRASNSGSLNVMIPTPSLKALDPNQVRRIEINYDHQLGLIKGIFSEVEDVMIWGISLKKCNSLVITYRFQII